MALTYYTETCNARFVPTPTQSVLACAPKEPLGKRPLLSTQQADHLVSVFKVLSNDSRLRLLHALMRSGELCMTELAEQLDMKPQAVSNQLQRLAHRSIVESRRDGNKIYYRILDPCVVSLLDQGLCLTEDARRRRSNGLARR